MNSIPSFFGFCIDVMLVVFLAWRSLCLLESHSYPGLVETTLGWLVLGLVWIVGPGVILGMTGALGLHGFLVFHGVALVLACSFRRNLSENARRGAGFVADWRQLLGNRSPESFVVIAMIIGLILLASIASRVEPAVFDALTYRFSRIGQWLQDGRITSYSTDDPRINYMPVGPDLVVAWLLGATDEGFLLAPLSQLIGGVLLIGATFGLARTVGLGRLAALGAVFLALGMANVAVQFTATQSDLFTAGVFSASYLLWHRALERSESSVVGALGIALAWGSKGTLFYLAPGVAIWVIWLVWRYRPTWRILGPTATVGLLAGLLFAGPSYFRNIETYGSLFGPKDAVLLHHGPPLGLGQRLDKLCLNLKTSALQLLDPTAQPFWCRSALRKLGEKFVTGLPATDDPYLFLHTFPRRYLAEGILQQTELDGDIASCGVLAAVLFLLGGIFAAWRWRDQTQVQILIWCIGVWVYWLVQHALVQWHQWAFRFAVLVAPWMAVAGASVINRTKGSWRAGLWFVTIVSCGEIAWRGQCEPHQAAWQSLRNPDQGMPQFVYTHWHAWADQLDDAGAPMRLALPRNSPLGAFYRTKVARSLSMEKISALDLTTAEQAVAGKAGWLIVPALKFMGREGAVMGFTFLYGGEGTSGKSLAAYRTLRPGETPRSIIYRATREAMPNSLHRTMLVRFWKSETTLDLRNPGALSWHYTVKTSSQKMDGVLGANENASIILNVNPEYISEIDIEIHLVSADERPDVYPSAFLVNP